MFDGVDGLAGDAKKFELKPDWRSNCDVAG
jgi:hypothetical protein